MKAEEHPLSQKPLIERITPGPWQWMIHDYSMATLHGPDEMLHEVMSVSPCGSCQETAKKEGAIWKWDRCNVPNEADAEAISRVPELLKAEQEREEANRNVHTYQAAGQRFEIKIQELEETISRLTQRLKLSEEAYTELRDTHYKRNFMSGE